MLHHLDPYGSTIRQLDGGLLHRSRNLRGLVVHARRSRPVCVITRKRVCPISKAETGGIITVVFADGTIGRSEFHSHGIMIDWVRNRRSWCGAEMRHADGDFGYLTRPGLIAGAWHLHHPHMCAREAQRI